MGSGVEASDKWVLGAVVATCNGSDAHMNVEGLKIAGGTVRAPLFFVMPEGGGAIVATLFGELKGVFKWAGCNTRENRRNSS